MNGLIAYAKSFLHTPYKWGGNSPLLGMDCSGFVQSILASIGMDPPGRDTAQSLYAFFSINGIVMQKPVAGCLIFYGHAVDQISHIAFAINEFQMIEAGGGDSSTLTKEIADKQNATVRIRPYNRRLDIVKVVMPQYPAWVLRS
jgi:cell wall-associated NlpC family hydrolase